MMRVLKIAVISIVSLFLIITIAGYVLLSKIDFNQYKATIVTKVKESTGRDLSVGDIKFKLSFVPTVEVSDVVFSNAEWANKTNMLTAKSIDVSVALIPLMNKSVVIDAFKIKDAEINLEENKKGQNNWTFDLSKVDVKQKQTSSKIFQLLKTAEAKDGSSLELLSLIVIKEVVLNNVTINYIDKDGKAQTYKINNVELLENNDKNIDFNFDINDAQYKGKGVVGALNLLENNSGYPIDAKLAIDGINLDAKVKLYDIVDSLSFDGEIKVFNFIGKNSGYNETLSAEIKGDLQNIDVKLKELNIAKNVIVGEMVCDLSTTKPIIKASFDVSKIDLALFRKTQKNALKTLFVKEAFATEMVSNEAVPYDVLNMLNMDADVKIGQILNNNILVANDMVAKIGINNGVAEFRVLQGKIAQGVVKNTAILNATNKTLKVNTSIENLNLIDLFKAFDIETPSFYVINGGGADVYINIESAGNTYSSLVENMNGNSVLIINKSSLHLGNIGAIKGNIISQLFNTLKVTKGDDNLDMSCAVVRADFRNKKMIFPNGIAINADKFTVVADGDINLKNDKLNISVKPFAGKITDTNIAKALSSLVKLTGTVSEPKIGVDGANAIKTIVGVTTAGPVYLGTQMLLENDGSPCYTALVGTGYESKFPKPKNVVSTTTEDVSKLLDSSVGAVKNTTKGMLNLLIGNNGKNKK